MTENTLQFKANGDRAYLVVKGETIRGIVSQADNGKWYFTAAGPFGSSISFLTSVSEFMTTLPTATSNAASNAN